MARPQSRVPFAQEAGRLRSLITQAQRQHLRPPPHLKTLDAEGRKPSQIQLQDARAAYYCERAVAMLRHAEEAWDDEGDDA